MIFTAALTGALIAISFSAPPGPVTLETVRRGVRGGFGPALHVQLGSILGDLLWCCVALLGLAPLAQVAWLRGALAVAGVLVLVYLGVLGIRDALKAPGVPTVEATRSRDGAFRSGIFISMANPMAVGYWLSVGGALIGAGAIGASTAQTVWFVAGFAGGTLVWAFAMAFAVRWSKRIMTPAIFRLVNLVCGMALLLFSVTLASQMLGPLN
ncbi:MAG TPA: LysE family transporter [Anaerolineae bacterium]|nr:LysE family transporter [Anaerolineae bacterium]